MVAIVVVVLISAFALVVFFSFYIRRCVREVQQADGSITRIGAVAAVSGSEDHLPLELQRGGVGQGLNKALVEALPILSFSVVKDLRRGREGSKESLDCAVCLNEFGKDDNLRLLPGCNHVFHLDCIDVWFQSHSTCPLCRSSLLPIFKELTDGGDVALEQASRRILEAQDQNCVSPAREERTLQDELSPRSFNEIPQAAANEQTTEGSGGSETHVVRLGERHSAKLALSRNSESFRQAARVAASSATYPSLPPTLDKGPRQTSSLKFPNLTGMDYYSIEMLPYRGSQRFGPAIGTAGEVDVGASSDTFAVELQRVENSENMSGGSCEDKYVLSGLTSPRDEDDWITIDIALDQNAPQMQAVKNGREMQEGRINGKSSTAANLGEPEVRTGSDRWSFSSLRGPLSLTRSASDGRRQLPATMHAERAHQVMIPPRTAAVNSLEQTQQQSGDATARGNRRIGPNQSFARRTMQWLAGSEKSSNSVAAVQETPSQQIVTPPQ